MIYIIMLVLVGLLLAIPPLREHRSTHAPAIRSSPSDATEARASPLPGPRPPPRYFNVLR